ncbi:type II secretion system F family protein [Streptomyces sp. enrichment culture]|uniref:type II secretion system F family protein n=1 Tax=Streptomyces sp. enrichment culture TaxID=1795815 RepID=UPI003F566B9B
MSQEIVHRLWVVLGVGLAMVWAAHRLAGVRRDRRARRRLAQLLAVEPVVSRGSRPLVPLAVRPWLAPVGVLAAGWVLVGGLAGVLVGVVGAGVVWRRWLRRARSGGATRGREPGQGGTQTGQLPLAADLLAACIAAGGAPVAAAQAVGEALGGPVGEALARGAAEVRLGGEPAEAWRGLAALPDGQGLARLLERADVSGLPAAGPVARLAADARADWARAATARARRAAVLVTAPVGLCFLPAFIAVGVLPMVIGLAGGVLAGGG